MEKVRLKTITVILCACALTGCRRSVDVLIASLALWVGTYLIGQLTPWMLADLTPAGTFFLFAFCCLPYLWIMWRHIPETTGKTLEEIEEYWKN